MARKRRTKSILLISRRLLQPPIQALEHDDVADGIAYMQGLAFHCESDATPVAFEVDGTEITVLRTSGAADSSEPRSSTSSADGSRRSGTRPPGPRAWSSVRPSSLRSCSS